MKGMSTNVAVAELMVSLEPDRDGAGVSFDLVPRIYTDESRIVTLW